MNILYSCIRKNNFALFNHLLQSKDFFEISSSKFEDILNYAITYGKVDILESLLRNTYSPFGFSKDNLTKTCYEESLPEHIKEKIM